jgi:anti-sigma B factor antagonist
MRLTHRYLLGACLITIGGDVDVTTACELEAYIDLVRRGLDDHLIIDATRLSFLDSPGLAVLLAAAVLAQTRGVAVHLTGLQPQVFKVLQTTGAIAAVQAHDHVEQALAAIAHMGAVDLTEPV